MNELRPIVAVGGVVIADDRRILLIRRGKEPGFGQWSVPAGKVKFGERRVDAVAREVFEETGLEVEVGELVWDGEIIDADRGVHFVVSDYRCSPVGGTLRAASDASQARWVTRDEARSMALVGATAVALDAVWDAPR